MRASSAWKPPPPIITQTKSAHWWGPLKVDLVFENVIIPQTQQGYCKTDHHISLRQRITWNSVHLRLGTSLDQTASWEELHSRVCVRPHRTGRTNPDATVCFLNSLTSAPLFTAHDMPHLASPVWGGDSPQAAILWLLLLQLNLYELIVSVIYFAASVLVLIAVSQATGLVLVGCAATCTYIHVYIDNEISAVGVWLHQLQGENADNLAHFASLMWANSVTRRRRSAADTSWAIKGLSDTTDKEQQVNGSTNCLEL